MLFCVTILKKSKVKSHSEIRINCLKLTVIYVKSFYCLSENNTKNPEKIDDTNRKKSCTINWKCTFSKYFHLDIFIITN